MGKLINQDRRKQAREQRDAARLRILDAARKSYLTFPFNQVDLDAIRKRARVRRGLPSLLFGSIESLFMELIAIDLEEWYRAVHARLSADEGPLSEAEAAGLFAETLAEREALTRLLNLLPHVLEHQMEQLGVMLLDQSQKQWKQKIARALEARVACLQPGDGALFLRRLEVLASGLQTVARPTGIAVLTLPDEGLEQGTLDYRTELATLLRMLLAAWPNARAQAPSSPLPVSNSSK